MAVASKYQGYSAAALSLQTVTVELPVVLLRKWSIGHEKSLHSGLEIIACCWEQQRVLRRKRERTPSRAGHPTHLCGSNHPLERPWPWVVAEWPSVDDLYGQRCSLSLLLLTA